MEVVRVKLVRSRFGRCQDAGFSKSYLVLIVTKQPCSHTRQQEPEPRLCPRSPASTLPGGSLIRKHVATATLRSPERSDEDERDKQMNSVLGGGDGDAAVSEIEDGAQRRRCQDQKQDEGAHNHDLPLGVHLIDACGEGGVAR